MRILTINGGSSSLKFAVHEMDGEERLASGAVDSIGTDGCAFRAAAGGAATTIERAAVRDHGAAIRAVLDYLDKKGFLSALGGVAHRVVHGGARFQSPVVITPALLDELRALIPLAPNHLPQEIAAIEAVGDAIAKVRQVACFDTAFHRSMPPEARTYPIPEEFTRAGVVRYGFHGLSYEYVMAALAREGAAGGRVIIAHLGNGASMAAVRDGRCIDTTMGFTPAGGLMMSTRTGDIDPGVILHLLKNGKMTVEGAEELVYRRSGLLGVSGSSGDMKKLLESSGLDERAREAVALFCYRIKMQIGAYTAALGGLDTLVFTGGIGENAPYVRLKSCEGLERMGVAIDRASNEANAPVVSAPGARVAARVMRTDEELMAARHAMAALSRRPEGKAT